MRIPILSWIMDWREARKEAERELKRKKKRIRELQDFIIGGPYLIQRYQAKLALHKMRMGTLKTASDFEEWKAGADAIMEDCNAQADELHEAQSELRKLEREVY